MQISKRRPQSTQTDVMKDKSNDVFLTENYQNTILGYWRLNLCGRVLPQGSNVMRFRKKKKIRTRIFHYIHGCMNQIRVYSRICHC